MPTSPEAILNTNHSGGNNSTSHVGPVLSLDDKLHLLLQYIKKSETALNKVQSCFSLAQSNPEDAISLQKAAKKLSEFCIDTDGWGFDVIYRVAFDMQVLLVDSFNRTRNDHFWTILNRGLILLKDLLKECENDYRYRLTTAVLLDNYIQAASR